MAASAADPVVPAAAQMPVDKSQQYATAGMLRSVGITPNLIQAAATGASPSPVNASPSWYTANNTGEYTSANGDSGDIKSSIYQDLLTNTMIADGATKLGYTGPSIYQTTQDGDRTVNQDNLKQFSDWVKQSGYTPAATGAANNEGNQVAGWLDPKGNVVAGTTFKYGGDDNAFWSGVTLAAGLGSGGLASAAGLAPAAAGAISGGTAGFAGTGTLKGAATGAVTGAASAGLGLSTAGKSPIEAAVTNALNAGGSKALVTAAQGGKTNDILKSFGIGAASSGIGSAISATGASPILASAGGNAAGAALGGGNLQDILKAGIAGGASKAIATSDYLKSLDPITQRTVQGAVTGALTGGSTKAAIIGAVQGAARVSPAASAAVKLILQQVLGNAQAARAPVKKGA